MQGHSQIFHGKSHYRPPFATSLNANISKIHNFGALVRAQDNFTEKKKLSEENFRLKQMFQSTNEENQKIRIKLKSLVENQLKTELSSLKVVNHNGEIDKLQYNIDRLRKEIAQIDADNQEIKIKLSKIKEKKFTIIISQFDEVMKSCSDDQSIEAKKALQISGLKSEIQLLNSQIQNLHKSNFELEESMESSNGVISRMNEIANRRDRLVIDPQLSISIYSQFFTMPV